MTELRWERRDGASYEGYEWWRLTIDGWLGTPRALFPRYIPFAEFTVSVFPSFSGQHWHATARGQHVDPEVRLPELSRDDFLDVDDAKAAAEIHVKRWLS